MCLEGRVSFFLLGVPLPFAAPAMLDFALDTLTGGLVGEVTHIIPGVTVTADRSGEVGARGVFPETEALMVTWKENTRCNDTELQKMCYNQVKG